MNSRFTLVASSLLTSVLSACSALPPVIPISTASVLGLDAAPTLSDPTHSPGNSILQATPAHVGSANSWSQQSVTYSTFIGLKASIGSIARVSLAAGSDPDKPITVTYKDVTEQRLLPGSLEAFVNSAQVNGIAVGSTKSFDVYITQFAAKSLTLDRSALMAAGIEIAPNNKNITVSFAGNVETWTTASGDNLVFQAEPAKATISRRQYGPVEGGESIAFPDDNSPEICAVIDNARRDESEPNGPHSTKVTVTGTGLGAAFVTKGATMESPIRIPGSPGTTYYLTLRHDPKHESEQHQDSKKRCWLLGYLDVYRVVLSD